MAWHTLHSKAQRAAWRNCRDMSAHALNEIDRLERKLHLLCKGTAATRRRRRREVLPEFDEQSNLFRKWWAANRIACQRASS